MTHALTLRSSLGNALHIESIAAQERLGRLFQFQMRLSSPKPTLDLRALLGTPMTAVYEAESGYKRYFHGIVTEIGQDGFETFGDKRDAAYWATLSPKPWLLSQKRDSRIYKNLSVPDIVKQVLGEFGYTDVRLSLQQTYPKRDYCVQYAEDYLNFISRLMEQEGIYYFFEHAEQKHTMVLADAIGAHAKTPKFGSLCYRGTSAGDLAFEDGILSLVMSREVHTTKYSLTDYDPAKPRTSLQADQVLGDISEAHTVAGLESFDYPGDHQIVGDGSRYARVRVEALAVPLLQCSGGSSCPGLLTGALFVLKEFPRSDLNQEYLVTGTTVQISNASRGSGGSDGIDFSCNFEVIPSARPFRTMPGATRPIISGLQTAVVCGSDTAEDIVVDKDCRVQVIFHWAKPSRPHHDVSCPVRVASFWAGKQWGAVHIPRVGQEVVVSFLEGDPDRPLIIGSVYNADNMPPYALPANKTQSGVKSRSHQDGGAANYNEFRFEDKKGSEEILLHAEKDHREEVENDHFVDIGHDETEHIGHDRKHTIDNDEVFTIKNDRTHDVTGMETVTIGKDRSHTVKGKETIKVNGSSTIGIDGFQAVTVGDTYVLDVANEITIKTGAASINMKKDGTITIKGMNITVDASANLDLKAGANLNGKANVNMALEAGVQMSVKGDVMLNAEGGAMAEIKGGAMTTVKADGMVQMSGGITMIG